MHFATRVRTWRVAHLYSEIALSRKPFGIGHMYIYNFLLRVTDTVTSQNINLSSWNPPYILLFRLSVSGDFFGSGHGAKLTNPIYISIPSIRLPVMVLN
jgi:hypothetical protein